MAEIQRKGAKKQSQGAFVWDAVLTGISYMIPFIVGGGVLWGIAKAMGGYNVGNEMAGLAYTEYTPAMVVYAIGSVVPSLTSVFPSLVLTSHMRWLISPALLQVLLSASFPTP